MSIKKKVYDIKPPRDWHNVTQAKNMPEASSLVLKREKTSASIETKTEHIDVVNNRAAGLFSTSNNRAIFQKDLGTKHSKTLSYRAVPNWVRKSLVPISVLIGLGLFYVLGFVILPKATVNINTIKTPGVYNTRVFIATPDASDGITLS